MTLLETPRLHCIPITVAMVQAVFDGNRTDAERLCDATLPDQWPGRALIEQAFSRPWELLRQDPATYLWGCRLLISKELPRQVIGSVVFDKGPDDEGIVEIAYGVSLPWQGHGYASEATQAVLRWALTEPEVRSVRATTPAWHTASLRIIEKMGMSLCGRREHEMFGELLVFEVRGPSKESTDALRAGVCSPTAHSPDRFL